MRHRYSFASVVILLTYFIMLITPVNLWQSNQKANGCVESRTLESKNPIVAAYQPPVPFDPNVDFQFNTSERCERNFTWTNLSTSNVVFEKPPSYNSTYVNMTFRVFNTTLANQTIIPYDSSGESSYLQQAQGFNITLGTYLYGFSIYTIQKNVVPTQLMSIKAGSPDGTVLSEKNVTLPASSGWLYIPLQSPLYLTPGHYYVYWPKAQNSQVHQWGRTGETGILQDCYVFSTGWSPQTWNLTLKIHVKNTVDPESVGMQV
ncbi:MAG: hypothetical protein RBG13Loki_3757, partial [Promethearchaeota archaeon CR_4]